MSSEQKSTDQKLMEMVGSYDHPPCVVCGREFLSYGSPEAKRRANVCHSDDCHRELDERILDEIETREYQDYLNGVYIDPRW